MSEPSVCPQCGIPCDHLADQPPPMRAAAPLIYSEPQVREHMHAALLVGVVFGIGIVVVLGLCALLFVKLHP